MAYFRHSIENCVICFVVVIVVVDLIVIIIALLFKGGLSKSKQSRGRGACWTHCCVSRGRYVIFCHDLRIALHVIDGSPSVCMFTRGLLDSVFCIVCKFFVKKHKFYCYIRSVTLYFLHILYHNFFLFFRFRWGTACTYWGWTLGVWCKFSDL